MNSYRRLTQNLISILYITSYSVLFLMVSLLKMLAPKWKCGHGIGIWKNIKDKNTWVWNFVLWFVFFQDRIVKKNWFDLLSLVNLWKTFQLSGKANEPCLWSTKSHFLGLCYNSTSVHFNLSHPIRVICPHSFFHLELSLSMDRKK